MVPLIKKYLESTDEGSCDDNSFVARIIAYTDTESNEGVVMTVESKMIASFFAGERIGFTHPIIDQVKELMKRHFKVKVWLQDETVHLQEVDRHTNELVGQVYTEPIGDSADMASEPLNIVVLDDETGMAKRYEIWVKWSNPEPILLLSFSFQDGKYQFKDTRCPDLVEYYSSLQEFFDDYEYTQTNSPLPDRIIKAFSVSKSSMVEIEDMLPNTLCCFEKDYEKLILERSNRFCKGCLP